MKFPSIKDVALCLRFINMNVEGECDVRLQVYENGQWCVRSGDCSFDTDHRGYWGSSSVPSVVSGKVKRFNSRKIAKDLILQAKEQYVEEKL
jgi:hypothetical protein